MNGMDMSNGLTVDMVRTLATDELPAMREELNCKEEGCDSIFESFLDHPTWFCNNQPNVWPGGSWIGHFLPGLLFSLWATHWMIGIFRTYFESRLRGVPYMSRAAQPFFLFGPNSWYLESIVKLILAPFGIAMELYLAHGGHYRRLMCAEGELRAGHLVGNHINNFQHASMYPAFFVSGLVDLLGARVDFPRGVQQICLGMAFLIDALLMGLHKKHTPVDLLVHEQLFYAMAATALFAMAEAGWPNNVLLSAGRVAAAYLQSMWFFASARIIFEGYPAWDDSNGDMAPAMYLPIFYVSIAVGILFCMAAVWLAMYFVYRPPPVTDSQPPGQRGRYAKDSLMPLAGSEARAAESKGFGYGGSSEGVMEGVPVIVRAADW